MSTMRVMSYNIRYDNEADGINKWSNRYPLVISTITFIKPTIFGLQECLYNQIQDIKRGLGDKYDYVGVGRDDGDKKGEFSPIFYNVNKIKIIDKGHFWISEDSYKPGSKSWQTVCPRIATWAKCKHVKTGKDFFFLNTHLDHMSQLARSEGTLMIKSFLSYLDHSIPSVFVGDFNDNEKSKPISNILEIQSDHKIGHKYLNLLMIPIAQQYSLQRFHNASNIANHRLGPKRTFSGFNLEFHETIDYIFVNDKFKVNTYAVMNNIGNTIENPSLNTSKLLASDHFPVVSDLIWN